MVQSPKLRGCHVALALLGVAVGAALGCKDLTPKQQERIDRFECEAAALAPLVEPALDAAELLRDLYAGRADLRQVARLLELSQAELEELVERLNGCRAPEALPAGDDS